MIAMMIWVLALAGGIAGVALTAALEAKTSHMAATAFITLGIVAAAVNDHRSSSENGTSPYRLAALSARYIGLLWAWSGISSFVVYSFVLEWSNWGPTVFAMFTGAVMYLFVGLVLDREARAPVPDTKAPVLLAFLNKCQFALAATLFGILFAMQQHPIFGAQEGGADWVAVNLAMGTAAGLLTLTGYLILHDWQVQQNADHANA